MRSGRAVNIGCGRNAEGMHSGCGVIAVKGGHRKDGMKLINVLQRNQYD